MKKILTLLTIVILSSATTWAKSLGIACEQLFTEDVTNYKNASVSINQSPASYFRKLEVKDNVKLVLKMKELVDIDGKLAFNTAEKKKSDGSYQKILNIPIGEYIINIGFFKTSDSDASIFIEGPSAAFE
ncbi:MAG: hypothetical protein K2L90_00030 [Muribaculaceae bacterium]|nr:hypothetical protein [Muribaculaceae bacterium]